VPERRFSQNTYHDVQTVLLCTLLLLLTLACLTHPAVRHHQISFEIMAPRTRLAGLVVVLWAADYRAAASGATTMRVPLCTVKIPAFWLADSRRCWRCLGCVRKRAVTTVVSPLRHTVRFSDQGWVRLVHAPSMAHPA
jgi:hypothetical protein